MVIKVINYVGSDVMNEQNKVVSNVIVKDNYIELKILVSSIFKSQDSNSVVEVSGT